jgi:hypothetical protein
MEGFDRLFEINTDESEVDEVIEDSDDEIAKVLGE